MKELKEVIPPPNEYILYDTVGFPYKEPYLRVKEIFLMTKDHFIDGWGRKVPNDIFKYIIGYEDLKYDFKIALVSPDPISAIMVGVLYSFRINETK